MPTEKPPRISKSSRPHARKSRDTGHVRQFLGRDVDPEPCASLVGRCQVEHIRPVVKNGWVTLEGNVECNYQRESAENAARRVPGVKGVSNLIKLQPRAASSEIKRNIEEAFRRSVEVDASRISVETRGGEVILKGTVRSWAERREAERAASAAAGMVNVDIHITISP